MAITLSAFAPKESDATRALDNVRLEFDQVENRVTLVARNPRESGFRFTWTEEELVDLRFRISVPRQSHVDLRIIHGSAIVGNLAGRIAVRIEHGGLFLRNIDGSVRAQVDFGDVILSRCSGAVNARVLRGLIRVGPIGGRAELSNATGDIEVMAVKHSIRAEAQVGDVRIGFAPGLAADSHVSASGGSVIASIHSRAACRVDAAATWGRVNSQLPLAVDSGADGQRSLSGRLNGGGPLLHLRASGGSITLEHGLLMTEEEG
jgi:hypothetical protein